MQKAIKLTLSPCHPNYGSQISKVSIAWVLGRNAESSYLLTLNRILTWYPGDFDAHKTFEKACLRLYANFCKIEFGWICFSVLGVSVSLTFEYSVYILTFVIRVKEQLLGLPVPGQDGQTHLSLRLCLHVTKYPENCSTCKHKRTWKGGKKRDRGDRRS